MTYPLICTGSIQNGGRLVTIVFKRGCGFGKSPTTLLLITTFTSLLFAVNIAVDVHSDINCNVRSDCRRIVADICNDGYHNTSWHQYIKIDASWHHHHIMAITIHENNKMKIPNHLVDFCMHSSLNQMAAGLRSSHEFFLLFKHTLLNICKAFW